MRILLALAAALLLASFTPAAEPVSGPALLEIDDAGLLVALDTDGDQLTDTVFTFVPVEPLEPQRHEFDRLEVTHRDGDDGLLVIRGDGLYLELHVPAHRGDQVPEHRGPGVTVTNGIEMSRQVTDRYRVAPWKFDRSAAVEMPDGSIHTITCKKGTDLVGADDDCTSGGPGATAASLSCDIGFGTGSIGGSTSVQCGEGFYACTWCKWGVAFGRCRSMTCSDHFDPEEP